jgi:protein-tyrosine phosphatase
MIAPLLRSVFAFATRARAAEPACRILFVCMGNVCRSPTAESVFRHMVEEAGLASRIVCASAGTHDFNRGSLPDGRAREIALQRGYDMSRLRGRHVDDADFERFDLILAMDRPNLDALRQRCPSDKADRLKLLMEFARRHAVLEVPDPYYSNTKGFEVVLDMIEDACSALLDHVRSSYLQGTTQAGQAPQ